MYFSSLKFSVVKPTEHSLSKYWFINLMDVSQCYAGSGLLYFSLDLNSRKSLFGPLVNLGMPEETHFPVLSLCWDAHGLHTQTVQESYIE